jgi:hypothetical protein
MIKRLFIGFGFVLVFLLGLWVSRYFYQWNELQTQETSEVLLERMQAVAKLVTVEGYFSEVYDYKDYYGYDLGLFRKKALIRVKAKVSVGYDLSQVKLEARPEEKRIILSNLPEPTILSIDHDVDYYDISEGVFNSFSAQDYTKLNQRAKNYIEERAKESDLLESARKQGVKILDMMRFMVEQSGWQLEYQERTDLLDVGKLLE